MSDSLALALSLVTEAWPWTLSLGVRGTEGLSLYPALRSEPSQTCYTGERQQKAQRAAQREERSGTL